MARMDAMTMKMDALYKEMQSRSNHPILEYDEDDKPMSPEAEAKFMQTFRRTHFIMITVTVTQIMIIGVQAEETIIIETTIDQTLMTNSTFKDRIPNYGKFLKELVSNKHKREQISSAFMSDESSAMIQNKVPPKLGDPGSFLIPCTFSKDFSCNALADLGASINLMPYSLYAKLSLETLKLTKMSERLADQSFQHPIGIAKNMLVEVGKFTFPVDFVILKMEEDSKVPLILGRPFSLYCRCSNSSKTKTTQSWSCIDVIDEILEEDFDALLDGGSEILHSIEGTIIEEKLFAEFDEFMSMDIEENSESKSETKEMPFEKITFNTDYKIKTSLEEPPSDLELKPLPDHLEYVFLELLQEFDIEIKYQKGTENVAADHLSRIDNDETSDDSNVEDNFPGETLMDITTNDTPWFMDFVNYLVGDIIPKRMMYQ
ncbi:reverse transcriptase domain-containing protein [Tanacetum coccineum]